jgi:alpha-1,3/alpha-1,6-mannosyltransferase
MKVLFVHPDLGMGGAERLIVDAALATKECGHEVTILTNHYDLNHCFEDTKQLKIITKGSSLPRQIGGRFHAFLAYFKLLLASIWIIYFSGLKFDVIICDQISLPVLIFKLNKYKVLFYCHFPVLKFVFYM